MAIPSWTSAVGSRFGLSGLVFIVSLMLGTATVALGQSITLTSPNGGNVWEQGQSRAITWTSSGVSGGILIQPYINGVPQAPLTTNTYNDGYFLWNIPSDYPASAYVRIGISAMSGSVSDFSNSNFTIRPPAITVTTPNGGESWSVGETRRIQWTNTGVYASIRVEISRNGGSSWSTIESGLPGNYYYRDWTVTSPASSSCRIRVTGYYEGGSRYDTSNSNFSIISPSLDVTWPNGGETLYLGHDYTIHWNSSGGMGGIAIDLYKGGTNLMRLAGSTSDDGSYPFSPWWELAPGSDYRIAVSAQGGTVYDFGGYFTIATPTIQVLSPNGGETWDAGSMHTITWTSNQVTGSILIQPYLDGVPQAPLTTGTYNDGAYSWTIPTDYVGSTRYTIGVSAMDGHVSDFSNGYFTINALPATLTITSPNGGQTLWAGHDFTATWSSQNVFENVKLELYRGTTQMITQFEAGTPNDGAQLCALPAWLDAAGDYRLAISTVSGDPYDFSDAPFTIALPSITITSPAGGGQYQPGDTVPIDWSTDHVQGTLRVDAYVDGAIEQVLDPAHPDDGHIDWVIPLDFPDSRNVRIGISAFDGHISDFTEYFTVGDPPEGGFDYPVGYPDGDGYNHTAGWDWLEWTGTVWHPGEDWNGNGGGDSDLGDPVHAVADGVVTASGNYGAGWGDITVIRHDNVDGETLWSQYAHLQDRIVTSGPVTRGQQIGTIGKGYANEYYAHLHFEIRRQDMAPDAWPTGWSVAQIEAAYYCPSEFIDAHRSFAMPSLAVTSPTGGETWIAGGTYEITWDHSDITGTIQIQPYLDTQPFTNIAAGAPNTGSFYWTIPDTITSSDLFRIGIAAPDNGVSHFSGYFTIDNPNTGVDDPGVPEAFALHACVPNPFNPSTRIAFSLPEEATVTLRVFTLSGRLVTSLLDRAPHGPGRHEANWNGRDSAGRPVPAGAYVYRIQAGSWSESRRMMLVK